MKNEDSLTVDAVSVNLPKFYPHSPDLLFIQAEVHFRLKNITADDTKYWYLVSALQETEARRIIDFLKAPPTKNKYEALKQRLSKTFQIGRRAAGAKLLHLGGLGDRKPSELMDVMLELSPTDAAEPHIMFEQAFLKQLPEYFQ